MCLITFWKCYFPPPPPQNPPPHNKKTTKTPPPTLPQQQQQNQRSKRESKKSKSQKNFITKISNENENKSMRVGSSVRVGSRCEWVRRGSSMRVGSQCEWVRRCEWVHQGSSVRVGSRCDDLSTLSVSLFARGPEMARRSRWSVTGFDEGGFERSEWCDRLTSMRSSCSDVGNLLALSLSLSPIFQGRKSFEVKMKTEIIFRCFGSNFWSTGNAF